jgi:hypothetical protein
VSLSRHFRPCTVHVRLVHSESEFGQAGPVADATWRDLVRTGLAEELAVEVRRALADLPVDVQVVVLAVGEPAIEVCWTTEPGATHDPAGPTAKDEQDAARLTRTVARTVAARYALCLRLAKHDADRAGWTLEQREAEVQASCPACLAEDTPIAARYLRPGDRITEVDTPGGPWYAVVQADPAAGLLVVDAGDGDPVLLPVDDWGASVIRQGTGGQ